MNEPPRLSEKSLRVLRLIADGQSYARIMESEADLNYHDIFFAAEEALWVDERLAAWLAENKAGERIRPTEECAMHRAKALHPRAYQAWTEREDEELKVRHASGTPVAELARYFQRQESAIRSRLSKLFPPAGKKDAGTGS